MALITECYAIVLCDCSELVKLAIYSGLNCIKPNHETADRIFILDLQLVRLECVCCG